MKTEAALPTGTLTFLFTDIEGSTRLLQGLGDDFHTVLNDHHRILRGALAGSGGTEVTTEGDAFFVVFGDAPSAARAAAEAQRALAAHAWPQDIEVRVRMGMHTGIGTLVGDNYGGIDVHLAARIASAAHGGQVLLSATTEALIRHSLPPWIRTRDLGRHRLKDIERLERLFQLCIDGLPADLPPLRTFDAMPNNLPITATPFIGRDREQDEIRALLAGNRLVTLTGPGGTGKTRLALAVGEKELERFPDGVFVAFLAPVQDPGLVPSTVAQVLGLREQGMVPVDEMLHDGLQGRRMLLILDNFEQVTDAAPSVADLLAICPDLHVLVTSRTPLRLAGEQEYAVPPMVLPDPDDLPPLQRLRDYEGIDLFVQRANSVKPSFVLDDHNAAAVVKICRRLDGLPLAIELAAARIRIMTPQEILRRLDTALTLLTGGGRDVPQRQKTLRDTIAWSYDLLDGETQTFFRRLAVFLGGFTLEAAEAVADAPGNLGLDAMERVVENSLVRRFDNDDGTTRFRMLETIRQFGLERLHDCGDEPAVRRLHAEWCLSFVEETSPNFTKDPAYLDRTEQEHDNIRAALRWFIDHDDGPSSMKLGHMLWRFWQMRAHLAEGRRWLTEIITMPGAAGTTAERGQALMALGSITYWQNDFAETHRCYGSALEIFRAIGDEAGVQEALYNSGFLSLLEKEWQQAIKVFTESRELAGRRDDRLGLANTAWGLAMAAVQARRWDEALRWGHECRGLFEELGEKWGRGLATFVFYQEARYNGRPQQARQAIAEWVELLGEMDLAEQFSALELLAEIELVEGNLERALRIAGAAAMYREVYGGGSPAALVELSDPQEVARSTLDADVIDTLWEQGRRMEPPEALAYALKDPAS